MGRQTDIQTERQTDRRETDTLMSGSQLEMQTCQHEMFYSLRVIYVIYSNVGRVKENHDKHYVVVGAEILL